MSLEETPEPPEKPGVFGYAQYVWHYVVREGSVIRRAPFSFVIAMLVVGAPVYWFVSSSIKEKYSGQIDDLKTANEKLDATAKSLQATIEYQDHKLAGLVSTPASQTVGGTSKLKYTNAIRLAPAYPVRVNFYYTNAGGIAAKGAIFSGDAGVADKALGESELDTVFVRLKDKLKDAESRNVNYEVQPGDGIFYTIQSSTITQPISTELSNGHGFLYTFALMEYKDENTPPGRFRLLRYA